MSLLTRSVLGTSYTRCVFYAWNVQQRKYTSKNPEIPDDVKEHPYLRMPVLEEKEELTEEEIERKRNKSLLQQEHFNIVHGLAPPIDLEEPRNQSLAAQRKFYGLYGSDSGVDPAICFPTKEEVEEFKEYEKVYMTESIFETRKRLLKQLEEEKAQYKIREEKAEAAMKSVEERKRLIRERMEKKIAEAEAAKVKREQLLEEVRRHFGYQIDYKDERFQLMLEQKEKELKKLDKEAKRKKRDEFFLKKLAQLEADAKAATERGSDKGGKDSQKADEEDGENKKTQKED